MRRNKQDQHQCEKVDQLQNKVHRSKLPVRRISPIAGILVFLLMAILGSVLPIQVKQIYAMSACGVLFLCPTPTPTLRPTPFPTPASRPTPSPIPTPSPRPTPLQVSSPTASTRVSPTAIAANISANNAVKRPVSTAHVPARSPTNIPPIKGGNARRQAPRQLSGSGFSSMMVIAAVIFLCLLFSLGLSLFVLRRVLLPPIDVKLPPSNATPWSRNGVPNPNSLGDLRL